MFRDQQQCTVLVAFCRFGAADRLSGFDSSFVSAAQAPAPNTSNGATDAARRVAALALGSCSRARRYVQLIASRGQLLFNDELNKSLESWVRQSGTSRMNNTRSRLGYRWSMLCNPPICAQCHTALTVKFPAILLGHSVLLERAGGCRTWPRPPTFHCDRAERLLARGRKWVISLARYGRGGGHWVGVG